VRHDHGVTDGRAATDVSGTGETDLSDALPGDNHVHSQWSWDTDVGDMERTCARAVELGLPSIAVTEHADFSTWTLGPDDQVPDNFLPLVVGTTLTPPPLDLDGYLECLDRCRRLFPTLRILSGVEMSEPHWYADQFDDLIARGGLQRRLASVHTAHNADGTLTEVSARYAVLEPYDVVRAYLGEVVALVEGYADFQVLAHIDYPLRSWPGSAPFDPGQLEDDYRHALRTLARADKALELNTRLPLHPQILRWWRQEGGQSLSFASDAHQPDALAHGFREARRAALAAGFRPGSDPVELWVRD